MPCKMSCQNVAPKKFLCVISLRKGSLIIAIIMIIAMILCIIALSIEASHADIYDVHDSLIRYGLGSKLVEIGFTILMLIMHIILLIGVKKTKASMIISWIAVQSIWLAHKTFVLIILLLLYLKVTGFITWVFALVFGIIGIIILLYFLLVVYGYWLEIKGEGHSAEPAA